jgi:hypothetical protein
MWICRPCRDHIHQVLGEKEMEVIPFLYRFY